MDTHDKKHTDSGQAEIAAVKAGKPIIDTFGTVIFFVVVIEIILIFGLNLYQDSRIKSLSSRLTTQKQTLSTAENVTINTQINEVLDGADSLKTVLNGKVKWSKFYTLLNAVTPKNSRVTALNITESGTFNAEGVTTSLSDLAKVLVAWEKGTDSIQTPFANVVLNSNGYSEVDGNRIVTFSVSGSVITGLLN